MESNDDDVRCLLSLKCTHAFGIYTILLYFCFLRITISFRECGKMYLCCQGLYCPYLFYSCSFSSFYFYFVVCYAKTFKIQNITHINELFEGKKHSFVENMRCNLQA